MFKILDGREMFYQWDTNRKLLIEDRTILQVHFCNRTSNCSIVRCAYDVGGLWVVDVPDIVLQESYRLNVYGYNTEYTKYSDNFNIVARSKPADYITNETEKQTWEQLEERIAAIEENGVSEEVVVNAVNEYLKENPVSAGATAAEAAQIAANKEDIAAIKAVAETHATEAYVDAAIANAQIGGGSGGDIDLTDYATKKYVDDAVAAVDNAKYVVKATQNVGTGVITFDKTFAEINDAYSNGEEVVVNYSGRTYELSKKLGSNYTFLWMNNEGWDEITINSSNTITNDYGFFITNAAVENKLDGYAKETYVDNALTSYAKTTDIPDVSGYQTAEQVNAAIVAYVGAIENGTY